MKPNLGLRAWMQTVGWIACALGGGAASGATIYEVPENDVQFVGARDVNIMADDVHFGTASIVKLVRIRLAIRGSQTCKLWLFDALDEPPIHVAEFMNVPATNATHVSTYDVPMHVQVPRDVFVGFSAQGDGWTNGADFWSQGGAVSAGGAGTPGDFYYGPVTGEQLTATFNVGAATYGCLQIQSEPVRIEGATAETGQVRLAIAELPIHGTNVVEGAAAAAQPAWTELETLPPGASNHAWTADVAETAAFYRVRTR
ncbi:MAG: hypothetical protein AB7V22_01260 [Kiritimatiellia bacterium]